MDQGIKSAVALRILIGFVAGFLATLLFHQLLVGLLWKAGIINFAPFDMKPTLPFGVPSVISLAFWGGLWGIVYVLIHDRFGSDSRYWTIALFFGGIFPSLGFLLVVLPMKGAPIGGGWAPGLLLIVFLVNAAWGVGTGLFAKGMLRWASGSRAAKGSV